MSDTKVKANGSAGPKKAKEEKAEPAKKKTESTAKPTDTAPADKTEAAPKSASQTSVSHFSSVSTPEYKAGWDSIFGGSKKTAASKPKTDETKPLPSKLTLYDEDIDKELRAALYKVFQKQARKQGISLAKIKKQVEFEYKLDCYLKEQ